MEKTTYYKEVQVDLTIDPKPRKTKKVKIAIPSFDRSVGRFRFNFSPINQEDELDLTGAKIIMTSMFDYVDENDQEQSSVIIDDTRAQVVDATTVLYEVPKQSRGFDGEIVMNIAIVMPTDQDGVTQQIDVADISFEVFKSALDEHSEKLPELVYTGYSEIVESITDGLSASFTNSLRIDDDGHLIMTVEAEKTGGNMHE